MTNFIAVYLMVQLAFALMITVLIWRYWPIYIASGLCWGVSGIYCIVISHGGMLYVWAFAFLCLAMAILMFFGNWWIPKKYMQKDEYSQFSTFEDWESGKQKKTFNKSWGKPLTDAEKKQKEIDDDRARGKWRDDPE